MTKPVILTGIRANNDLHIGNYFGAMLPAIDMATKRSNEYEINMFIPDLHSFTTPIDHSLLFDSIMNNARVYVAAGLPLDNDNIHLYRQSYVPAHSELTWILDCFTGFGEMERMTQFKEKSDQILNDAARARLSQLFQAPPRTLQEAYAIINTEAIAQQRASVGLFNYPVLMAADILLYGAKYIPVGDDQTQHLEFTRDIAQRMNRKFGELFTVPEQVVKQHEFFGKDQGLRIKDLIDPSKKMSKSDDTGRGVIFLSDSPEVAKKKIMGATTDGLARVNYDKTNQPGISNLLEILTLVRQANGRETTLEEVCDEFTGMERYGDFKKIVADEIARFLENFQAKLSAVSDGEILDKLEKSEFAMNTVAKETLLRVQKAIGLRR
ncbi:tryptophan--tRNA ligase [Candidatus Saccharibacteria bacterium oral taxon 955]|nr:tryptophan--tRNA ligase [Candidatus Saccharibacteria bacterium oral taxon 955]